MVWVVGDEDPRRAWPVAFADHANTFFEIHVVMRSRKGRPSPCSVHPPKTLKRLQ